MTKPLPIELEAMVVRVRKQPLLQAFRRAVAQASPEMAARIDEAEHGTPDNRMPVFLDALDAELEALLTAERERTVDQVIEKVELRRGLFGGEPMTSNELAIVDHILAAIRSLKGT